MIYPICQTKFSLQVSFFCIFTIFFIKKQTINLESECKFEYMEQLGRSHLLVKYGQLWLSFGGLFVHPFL